MRIDAGEITTDRNGIARCMQDHWRRVFQRRPIDGELLERWLDSLPALTQCHTSAAREDTTTTTARPQSHSRRQLPADHQWRVRRQDIEDAINGSGNSSPGTDGIPYQAWRSLGTLAVEVLWDVAKLLESDNAGEAMRDAYATDSESGGHGYNLSTLVCSPRGQTLRKAHSTRPTAPDHLP